MIPNMLGGYAEWAAQTMPDPPRLSFRQPMFDNVEAWRAVARARYRELLMGPGGAATPVAAVQHHLEFDGFLSTAAQVVQSSILLTPTSL